MNSAVMTTRLEQEFGLDQQQARVLIIGLGETGMSVARFLNRMAIRFAIVDSREKPPRLDELLNDMPDVPVFTGAFNESAISVATHLIVSPGVSLNENIIAKAIDKGAQAISDIDLFACSTEQPVVAITGSNGKSTVTTMVGDMARCAGLNVAVGGNLGVPVLDLLAEDVQLYVVELSSFQLERTSKLQPVAATVLNISPDHLDRHQSVSEYSAAKETIFNGNGVMVLNADDPFVDAMEKPDREVVKFSLHKSVDFWLQNNAQGKWLMHGERKLMPLSDLPLEGLHNAANALSALALGHVIGLSEKAMVQALTQFKGLKHRMQKVADINGVTWINDSKATNIGACIAALQGYDKKVILIAGGDAKGADMQELKAVVEEKVKSIILIGKDAPLIDKALAGCVPVCFANSMLSAVQTAAELAAPGDHVLLSPACASIDQYKNYQERGEKFATAVLGLVA